GHHPDPAVAGVGDHQVARGVHGHALRVDHVSLGGLAAVAGEAGAAAAGHGVDVAGGHGLAVERAGGRGHHAHPLFAGGDHQVALGIHGHAVGEAEGGGGRWDAVAGAAGAAASHGVDE